MLISASELESKLSSVCVLDCTIGEGAKNAYLQKHIAGAVFLSMGDFRDATSPLPNMLPTKEQVMNHL